MIDTLEGGFLGPALDLRKASGWAIVDDFRRAVVGPIEVKCRDDEEGGRSVHPKNWRGVVPGLGHVTLNVDGYVRIGRSLAKAKMDLDGKPEEVWHNNDVLSADEVNKTVQALIERSYEKLPWLDEETEPFKATRADVVYQRVVPSSMATIKALQGATKPTHGGCAWFDNRAGVPTGIILRGKAVAHRVYDKGLEAGWPGYENVLRSEEQLRSSSVGMSRVWCQEERRFSMAECRDVLNERYLDVAFGEAVDVSDLVQAGEFGVALFVKNPELLPVYKQNRERTVYYRMAKRVREHRALSVPVDLRVPEEAWR